MVGPGAEPPVRRKNFGNLQKISKIVKTFLRKLPKCIIFSYFTQHFTNPEWIFRAFGRKTQIVGNFEKIFENFPFLNMHYFCLFYTKFCKPSVNLSRVWTINTNCWKFWVNFRKISMIFLRKLLKLHYFFLFYTKLYKPCVNFRGFGRKTQIVGNLLRKF